MFLLGHSCWSYLFSKLTGRQVKVNLPAYMALLAGVLPDFDIYFKPLIQHHTYTHSLIILLPICAVLVIRFKGLGLAFSAGILSHLVADSIVGTIPPLYPLSNFQFGISLGLPSPPDTALEVGALGLVLVLAYLNGDYKLVTGSHRESVYLVIPLVSIVTLTLLFAGDNNVPLAALAFSRRALTLITLGHAVLIGILGLGVFQGVRAVTANRKQPAQASTAHLAGLNPQGLHCRVTPRLNPPLATNSHETTPEVSKIDYLTWWNFPKKAWLIILGELAIITSLSVSLYITYLTNIYFQIYVNSLSPVLVPSLSVAFGISSASIATYLYLGMKRIRTLEGPGVPVKKRVQQRKTSRRPPQPSTSQLKASELPPAISAKLKPIAPPQSHAQTQKPPLKEREDRTPNPENRKQL